LLSVEEAARRRALEGKDLESMSRVRPGFEAAFLRDQPRQTIIDDQGMDSEPGT
jgi:hypothetical protein